VSFKDPIDYIAHRNWVVRLLPRPNSSNPVASLLNYGRHHLKTPVEFVLVENPEMRRCTITIAGMLISEGEDRRKRLARENAAKLALKKLNGDWDLLDSLLIACDLPPYPPDFSCTEELLEDILIKTLPKAEVDRPDMAILNYLRHYCVCDHSLGFPVVKDHGKQRCVMEIMKEVCGTSVEDDVQKALEEASALSIKKITDDTELFEKMRRVGIPPVMDFFKGILVTG